MWNRLSGKSNDPKDDLPSQSTRRKDYEQRHPASRSGPIASSNSNKKSCSRADDRDPRGFNPTSTSYSSTTRGQYPGAASASIASSYATASGNTNGEPYVAPGLVRNASLADQMPRSSSSRASRDQVGAREARDKKRDKTERSDSRGQDIERRKQMMDKRYKKDKGLRSSENGLDQELGTSRGSDDFPDQVASSGFSQFPGQFDGAISGSNGAIPEHPAMSSHVQDQFPGQFPTQSSAPYRPPLAASEGGPGLAAEYYGDDGQSVAEQPGNRANTPSLIIGAEPHLQPALAVAAPPPEPSASGAVGAAASFFSGEFEEDEAASTHGQQDTSIYVVGQTRPSSNYHSSSAPVIPTIGGTAIGSAPGYIIDSQTLSHQQRPDHESLIGASPSEYPTVTTHRPPSQTQDSLYSNTSRPPKPGKQSSQSSNIPMYAAGVAGAAGLAAAAYEHNHHSSNQHASSTPQYSATPMAQRHRNHGPFGALVDFFKDPEGVAQFEEYSQIIGVCRHCFAPGSSPKDAPRKHFYGRRRSNERHSSSTRVDKDSRYYSSENESRRKNKSWLATGLAGYGLGKLGEGLFKEEDFGDTHSVKTRRFSAVGRDRRARRRSRSKERVETGIISDGKPDRKEPRYSISNGTKTTTHSTRRHSRNRSRSSDRKTGLTEAGIGAALATSMAASGSRRQSRSPPGTSVKLKHRSQAPSPDRRPRTKKKRKKDKGFFWFGNGSSSSSSVDLAYAGGQDKHRSSKRSNAKSNDDLKAEAALMGLGAAAAALALNDGRQSHRKKGVRELVGVKETKDHHGHGSAQAYRAKKPSGNLDDELWESAAEEDYVSTNSDLAYGAPVRRDSRASLSSESSGTNKWGWRWGRKKNRGASSPRRKSSDHSSFVAVTSTAGTGPTYAATTSLDQSHGSAVDSTSSLPLQHVYPVPTSDPSRFDVGREGSIASSNRPVMSSRPEAVPLQHPQPIVPVSAAIYSSNSAYDHSYSAPADPTVFSQTPYHHYPGTSDDRNITQEASIPGSFPRFEQLADDTARGSKIRRRDTSPARFGEDSISSSMASRRRTATKDDSSAVRFDLTEEQEERHRRERHRKRKQDKERREAEEQEQMERDSRVPTEKSSKKPGSKIKPEEGPERSSEKAWVGPVATGVVGAVLGAAAATEASKSEETREERRERRRRQRELEDEEDALRKSERRRRQRERDDQEALVKERGRLPDDASASSDYADRQGRSPKKQDVSVWQEAASVKRSSSHENYGAFFTPVEFLNKSSDQVKITSANADADIDLEQVPQVVTVEPKRIHDLSDSPVFSLADADDKIDPSRPSFPWQVPRLRLVEPTPPSTRGSTPIPQPKDTGYEGFEESRKKPSPSKVKWADDQSHDYKIISQNEDLDESIEPPSGEYNGTDPVSLSRSTHKHDLPDVGTPPHNDSTAESRSASYGEDAEFAATLAASAEDAGFDPSVVIDNPIYRRRDSPPGSNERSMPGGFDDEDEPRLIKKERKRKEKASRRQIQSDGPNQRDDAAVVQDIISQVEDYKPQPSDNVPSENFDEEEESTKKTKSKDLKEGRQGSESREDFFEASEIVSNSLDSERRDVYESPTEDVRSIASSAPISNEAESGRKPSGEKSERNRNGFDVAASTASSVSTTEASKEAKPEAKDKRRGSIWDRVLGKSTGSLPEENGAADLTEDAILEDFEEPKKKNKKSKGRKSTRNGDDDRDSEERTSIEGTTPQISGRISQDLPAKNQATSPPPTNLEAGSAAQYLDHDTELGQFQREQPDSFLGMRPEPPPPPDTYAESEGLFDSYETTSLPTSPRAESETRSRRFSDAETYSPTHTTAPLPSSPTAVPFHFRRPYRSSSTTRSLSQTPFSSIKSTADPLSKQKTRPRSTEFKSSKEIRPLWLVERHRSHQEQTPEETYPSLPSSHTTSRSSSVHDLEGNERHQRGDLISNHAEHEPSEVESGPIISTDSHLIPSDILNSQQATPTASSFHDSRRVQDLVSPQASRDSSPKVFSEENSQQSSSALKSSVLGAILGGSAALAMNEAVQNNDPSWPDLPQEENEEFEPGLEDMVPDTGTYQLNNDNLDQEEDYSPQTKTKRKKNERNAGQSQQKTVQPPLEAKPRTTNADTKQNGTESMQQLQEQDAQDAVASWFPSVLPSRKGKKGKKGKGRALVESLSEESGPSLNNYEPPKNNLGDNLGSTVPAEVQKSDTLARDMPRKQIGHIMTAAAQDAKLDGNEASHSATAVVREPFEIPQDEIPQDSFKRETLPMKNPSDDDVLNETQRKAHLQDNLPQDDLPQDGLPQDGLPQDGLPQDGLPQDGLPQDGLPQASLPQASLPQASLLQDDRPQDNVPQDDLPQSDLQREALPHEDPHETQERTYPHTNVPQGNLLRDNFSHSQGNLPQDEMLQSGFPQDSPPGLTSSAPAEVTFLDLFSEQGQENLLQPPKAIPGFQEEFHCGGLTTAISPPLELSPRATPLPEGDDDFELLDERLRTPTTTAVDRSDEKEVEVAARNPLDVPQFHNPSAVVPGPPETPQHLPAQAEQVDLDEEIAAPSRETPIKGKKATQNFSVKDNENTEIQEKYGPISNMVTSSMLEDNRQKGLNEEPFMKVSLDSTQEKSDTVGGEWRGATSKKKGKKAKKGKQGFSVDSSKTTEIQERQEPPLKPAASEAPEDNEAMNLIHESAFDVPQPETESIEDGWTGFNVKKKGKKGKKVKPSFSAEIHRANELEVENESLPEMVSSKAPDGLEARDGIDENVKHAPKTEMIEEEFRYLTDVHRDQAPKQELVEDEWAGFDGKTKGTETEKQTSKTFNPEPVSNETDFRFEGQPEARGDMNNGPSSLATTQTFQEVSDMLAPMKGEPNEAFPALSQEERILQKPSEDQIFRSDDQSLPAAYEPETQHIEDTPGKAHDDETSPTVDKSIAGTNAAQVVQEILAVENNAESATDAKRETVVAFTGMEETATDRPVKEDVGPDWDAPKKKKKGKKGKKKEAYSWDEPETIEPAEISGTPGVMKTPLEQEGTADKSMEEDELGGDPPQKKAKGNQGKKKEAYYWDEPETVESAEISGTPGAMSTPLEQEPMADRSIEEGEPGRYAPQKKKKGKKGKKSEVTSLDYPEIVEPAEISGPSAAMKTPPLEAEPGAKAIDEVSSKPSKKEGRDKKGKRKGVSRAISDFRDKDEPNDVPTETSQNHSSATDLPAIAGDSRNEADPSLVPTEAPQGNDRVEDPLAVVSELREEVRPNPVLVEAPQDDNKVEDLPTGGMPPMREELGASGDVLNSAIPTELAQDTENNDNERSRDATLGQEQDFMLPRSKRDKKKSKKSRKSNVVSLDDDERPTVEDGQKYGTRNLEGPEQMISSRDDVAEESKITAQRTQLEQEEDFMLPINKKDKKRSRKSKKFNAFSLDEDVSPALEDEPVFKTKGTEKEAPEQALPSSVDVSNINPLDASGDPVMMEGERGGSVHGYIDSASAHAAALGHPHKDTSSVTPFLEHPVDASEANTANQGTDLEDNMGTPVSTDIDPSYSVEQSQKDNERAEKARPLMWEENEISQEPTTLFKESSPMENPDEASNIPALQDSGSWSTPEISTQAIQSTEIVQPGIMSEEDQGFQESILEEQPSQARDDIPTMVEDEPEGSSSDVKKGNRGKGTENRKPSIPDPDEDRSAADEKGVAPVTPPIFAQVNEQILVRQPRDNFNFTEPIRSNQEASAAELKREEAPILTEPGAIDEAKQKELPWTVPVQRAEKTEKQHDEAQWGEHKIENLSSSVAPQFPPENVKTVQNTEPRGSLDKDEPIPEVQVEMLDAQEQRKYNEQYANELKRTVPNTESVAGLDSPRAPGIDRPIPAVEVEMLDAQEQRKYDEQYANELERTFPNTESVAGFDLPRAPDVDKPIPAVEVEMLDAQEQRDYNEEYVKELERQLSPLQEGERADSSRDEADTPIFSQSSIASILERPYEEEHRPLARPPALEDIIEESVSRPGSVQGSRGDQEDIVPPFRSTKKSKKGKKGKKQQPVIWEDETATPPLGPESDQGAKPSIRSSEDPGWSKTDAARPLGLEEPIEQRSLEDRRIASPTGDFNTAKNDLLVETNPASDYFAIQPTRPAEEDVGREDTHEFHQALLAEPPCSTRNRSPAREPQTAEAGHPRDGSLAADSHEKSGAEAEPAEEQVEDSFDSTKRSKKLQKEASVRKPSPQVLGQEDLMDRPQDLETPTTVTLNERPPSRQHSQQSPLHEDEEHFSVAEGSHTSRSRSGSMGGIAAAVGIGVSALAVENLSRRDSKEETAGKKGKWIGFETETAKLESPSDRGELPVENKEHRQIPEPENVVRVWQHHQGTPPQSPPSANYEAVADHPVVTDLGQSSATPQYRDSAIYVSGSPMVPEELSYHRATRDSGYPDTEASPVVDDGLENPEDPAELENGVAAGERVRHVPSRAHQTDERQRSTARNPFEISVEANSDYDVSVSRPEEKRRRSSRRSGAAYDSDDSADSGFDIQRRRRRQAMAGDPREPSPVSSTTKDRSSALFNSSPSAREETVVQARDQDVAHPTRKEPTWSFDRERSPQQQSRETSREGRSDNIPEHGPEPTGHESPTSNHEDTGTLFGGPRSYDDDLESLSRSPRSSESRGRQRLNTISEDSADGSPLHKKDKRAVSDVGSPESGVKGRRTRAPPTEDEVAGEYASTYETIPRQAWSAVDEEQRAVEERSRSRNSDELSTFSSRHSALSGVTPRHREDEYRTASAASMHSDNNNNNNNNNNSYSIHAIIRTPDQVRSASGLSYHSSGTPPLRRVDRSASGDLRGASRKSQTKYHAKRSSELEAEPELNIGIPSSSTYDPVTDKGKSRADMADVYEGWGDVRGQSPMSPTRPPSMRKRQSMQLLDLETRLDQIVSENRLLASQKLTAERALQEQARDHSQERRAYEEAMQEHKAYLARKDSELSELKHIIEQLHNQAAHLTEANEELASSRRVDEEHQQRYSQLQAEHANAREQWQQSTRELENLKEQHTQLSTGMEDIVRHEVTVAHEEKNLELRQLQSDLENAKQQVRDLQQQLLVSRNSDDFVERDEDYFDSQCQSLCQHVQQWVLRFSKFSDMKACYRASEIRDEKVVDRMENAILDGSDVDDYLSDRVKRRDVFMSVVMTMIWEFIFTRYLFGMDREQRQKLKNLEKTLQEVGPMSAVHKWRATTLTLLMKREAFENQRATDTEAVVHEIYDTLATFLPPPSHLVGQIQDSLRKVIDTAVDLSIEMRTQRAEYSMLPPLQPEYDTNGDLARKVYFSALTMNERSGATSSNEALQEQHAVVRMVLFPLVVKNEDDDEQIVVCPAQVLTAEGSKGKKTVRVMSAQGGRSEASFAGSDVRMEGGMI